MGKEEVGRAENLKHWSGVGEEESLQAAARVLQSGPFRADFLRCYRLSLLFTVRSSRVFKWLLLQIYNCFNLTPRAQRDI